MGKNYTDLEALTFAALDPEPSSLTVKELQKLHEKLFGAFQIEPKILMAPDPPKRETGMSLALAYGYGFAPVVVPERHYIINDIVADVCIPAHLPYTVKDWGKLKPRKRKKKIKKMMLKINKFWGF